MDLYTFIYEYCIIPLIYGGFAPEGGEAPLWGAKPPFGAKPRVIVIIVIIMIVVIIIVVLIVIIIIIALLRSSRLPQALFFRPRSGRRPRRMHFL